MVVSARTGPRQPPPPHPATRLQFRPCDPTERDRILTELAAQQTQQRQHHVTQLADLYTRITELRAALKTTEQTYRAT